MTSISPSPPTTSSMTSSPLGSSDRGTTGITTSSTEEQDVLSSFSESATATKLAPTHQPISSGSLTTTALLGEVESPISHGDLVRLMECPVCSEFPSIPIFTCQTGHVTCTACMNLLDKCTICQEPFTESRNFALENIIESSKFKCPYREPGCPEVVSGERMHAHAEKCEFRPVKCPEPDCLRQNLTPSEFLAHLEETHDVASGSSPHEQSSDDGDTDLVMKQDSITINRSFHVIKLVNAGQQQDKEPTSKLTPTFLIWSVRHRTFMCWWASSLHPDHAAGYSVTFVLNRSDNDHSVSWTLPAQSLHARFDEVRDAGMCAVMPASHLVPFQDEEESWHLRVRAQGKSNGKKGYGKKLKKGPMMFQHYYPLVVLVLVGIIAVLVTLLLEESGGGNQGNGTTDGITDNVHQNDGSSKREFADEYVGYRGFYYKNN